MKKAICLFGLLMCAASGVAEPIRSMLGAREGMKSYSKPSYTAKDYIQDGLIAMWDGIENTGWGVHDSNAKTWVDLVGSNNLTLSARGDFSDLSLHLKEGSGWGAYNSGIITNSKHIEICYCLAIPFKSYSPIFRCNSNRFWGPGGSNYGCYVGLNRNYIVGDNCIAHTGSFDYVNEKGYFNAKESFNPVHGSWSSDGSTLAVGARSSNATSTRTAVGDIFCIRIYSHSLSATEILHNYQIDKARFNLP